LKNGINNEEEEQDEENRRRRLDFIKLDIRKADLVYFIPRIKVWFTRGIIKSNA